ncbi:MAG: nucleoside diphosphate kinase regulator [Candidatus Methylomirabilales bacterium]
MSERTIYISDADNERLERLVFGPRRWRHPWDVRDQEYLQALEAELERAHIVPAAEIPADVVTMHSRVQVTDLDGGTTRNLTLVFPAEADAAQGKISVLAPLGTALLGSRAGDTVEWPVPGGRRRFRIEAVLHQPDAAAVGNPLEES